MQVHLTRMELRGCLCRDCGKTVLADASRDLERRSPFGGTIALPVTYVRYALEISYRPLDTPLWDVLGLTIS